MAINEIQVQEFVLDTDDDGAVTPSFNVETLEETFCSVDNITGTSTVHEITIEVGTSERDGDWHPINSNADETKIVGAGRSKIEPAKPYRFIRGKVTKAQGGTSTVNFCIIGCRPKPNGQ